MKLRVCRMCGTQYHDWFHRSANHKNREIFCKNHGEQEGDHNRDVYNAG